MRVDSTNDESRVGVRFIILFVVSKSTHLRNVLVIRRNDLNREIGTNAPRTFRPRWHCLCLCVHGWVRVRKRLNRSNLYRAFHVARQTGARVRRMLGKG